MNMPSPPPECPAHGLGPDGRQRLHGPEARRDPMALYEKLRAEHGPVAPVLVHGDLPAWLVLGHNENLEVARNPSRFSRDPRTWRAAREGTVIPADHPLGPMVTWWPVINFNDGPVFERLRGAVLDSLQRFDRRGVRRYVTRFAHQLIDGFVAQGRADLVADFSSQLPMLVATQLVGAPEEHGPKLVRAVRDMIQGTESALASDEYVTTTLYQLVENKKAARGHDLTSWLLDHHADLTDVEVLAHVRVVLVAAYETTANLIANTLRMVLTDHRFRASLSGGRMTLPDALEQVLWDQPPLNTILGRWATADTVLGGQQIKGGDMLLLGLVAGNVDPEIRPDLSQPVHGNRSHLAFSAGPHECPGQDIGRAIADTGIEALLSRLPDIELSVDDSALKRRGTLMSQHLEELPVTFTPQRPVGVPAGGTGPGPEQPPAASHAPDGVPAAARPRSPAGLQNLWPWLGRLFRRR
ncbi:putative cytochrome P450 [Streptomyces sp. NBRC 110611]|uniref:cytochrome P450 n=1 Tax=Streptomyces sp. NBRC 110611 TaxID=1621259 RepID=UPI0008338792|nr:cytochrome P450 [Streptomyces sp. NBRC 110611]GAU70370.1 putative cytochrome P450 [Streptomyces sp. NBRC 110611]